YRVLHGARGVHLVGAKRHIAYDQRPRGTTTDGRAVMDHLLHRRGFDSLVAENQAPQRIADEDEVESSPVDQDGGRIIVCGEASDRYMGCLALAQRLRRYLLSHMLSLRTPLGCAAQPLEDGVEQRARGENVIAHRTQRPFGVAPLERGQQWAM